MLQIGDSTYEITINPPAYLFSVYDYPNLDYNEIENRKVLRYPTIIYHKGKTPAEDSYASFGNVLQSFLTPSPPQPRTYARLNGKYLFIDSARLDSNYLIVSLYDSLPAFARPTLTNISAISGTLARNGAAFDWLTTAKPYTLLTFTGSWCQPCKTALPGLKRIAKTYKQVQIISIAAEKDAATAKQYAATSGIAWPLLYEPLQDNAPETCLHRQLNIRTYPHFILLDNQGERLLETSGSDGAEKIAAWLQKIKR